MRIQWSSGAAQEMLSRLERADEGLANCVKQAGRVRTALDEANADGGNQTLRKAKEQFEAYAQELQEFAESLEEFMGALRRTDRMFTETELNVARMALNLGETKAPPQRGERRGEHHASWKPEAFAVIPNMRIQAAVAPAWLERLTSGTKRKL